MPEEEREIAVLLKDLGVSAIEIAPTKQWQDPTAAAATDVQSYKDFWESQGFTIAAFQSMLFNRPDLKIFDSPELRKQTLEYLEDFIELAGVFGASAMVFGSPKNRQRGTTTQEEAYKIALPFFQSLGDVAQQHKTTICIEPNAPQYACDFVYTAQQGIELVAAANNTGFRLHLDIACMTLAGDDITQSITAAAPYLQHFHISSPMLQDVGPATDVPHTEAAAALRSIGYTGYVSIEMRPAETGTNRDRVERAVRFVQKTYGV